MLSGVCITIFEEVFFEGQVEVDAVAVGDEYLSGGLCGEPADSSGY